MAVQCLVCLVCACKHTIMCDSNQDIEYCAGRWLETLSEETVNANLKFAQFKARYASQEPLDDAPGLAENNFEWRRVWRHSSGTTMEIICCPEDIVRTQPCSHDNTILCPTWQIPICRECIVRMQDRKDPAVPKLSRTTTGTATCTRSS